MSKYSKIIVIGLFMFSVYLITSCVSSEVADSKDVNQETIYLKYYVTLDAENNTTDVEAIFRFGGSKGTSLTLSSPSKITVNGIELKGSTKLLSGYQYQLTRSDISENTFEFIFSDIDKKIYTNKYTVNPIEILSLPDSISKTQVYTINWEGEVIGNFEEVELILTDGQGKTVTINNLIKGSNSISISPEDIKELAIGMINVRIIRSINSKVENAPEIGGEFTNAFESRIHPVKLVN